MTTYQKRKLKAQTSQLSYHIKNYIKIPSQVALFLIIATTVVVAAAEASKAQVYALQPETTQAEQIVEIKQTVVVEQPMMAQPVLIPLEEQLPTTSAARREAILARLRNAGYSETDMQKWAVILDEETGGLKEHRKYMNNVEPDTFVKHCKSRATGKWYARELVNKNGARVQGHCNAGDLQGRVEKSLGIFQILPSTWERYKCVGDKLNWLDQINCAITLQRKDGFRTHWAYVK